jgi:hypothetical protein
VWGLGFRSFRVKGFKDLGLTEFFYGAFTGIKGVGLGSRILGSLGFIFRVYF